MLNEAIMGQSLKVKLFKFPGHVLMIVVKSATKATHRTFSGSVRIQLIFAKYPTVPWAPRVRINFKNITTFKDN